MVALFWLLLGIGVLPIEPATTVMLVVLHGATCHLSTTLYSTSRAVAWGMSRTRAQS